VKKGTGYTVDKGRKSTIFESVLSVLPASFRVFEYSVLAAGASSVLLGAEELAAGPPSFAFLRGILVGITSKIISRLFGFLASTGFLGFSCWQRFDPCLAFRENPKRKRMKKLQSLPPLSLAAQRGDHDAVAQLLADPGHFDGAAFSDALHLAATGGHSKVITQLLVANPSCIDAVDSDGRTALHIAIFETQHAVTKQLLAAKPELIKVLNSAGDSALFEAVGSGHRSEEELSALGITPEEVDIYGFGSVIRGECCHDIVAILYSLYPEAAAFENDIPQTPFLRSMVYKNDFAIELMQWKLSFDEIVTAFTSHFVEEEDTNNYMERYQLVMEEQCESLFPLLGDDLTGIVFEYLGLEARKRRLGTSDEQSTKRQRV